MDQIDFGKLRWHYIPPRAAGNRVKRNGPRWNPKDEPQVWNRADRRRDERKTLLRRAAGWYGIQVQPGETNASLRARCKATAEPADRGDTWLGRLVENQGIAKAEGESDAEFAARLQVTDYRWEPVLDDRIRE